MKIICIIMELLGLTFIFCFFNRFHQLEVDGSLDLRYVVYVPMSSNFHLLYYWINSQFRFSKLTPKPYQRPLIPSLRKREKAFKTQKQKGIGHICESEGYSNHRWLSPSRLCGRHRLDRFLKPWSKACMNCSNPEKITIDELVGATINH